MNYSEIKIHREGIYTETGGEIALEIKELSKIIKKNPDTTIMYIVGGQYGFMISLNGHEHLNHYTGFKFNEIKDGDHDIKFTSNDINGYIHCRPFHELINHPDSFKEIYVVISSSLSGYRFPKNKTLDDILEPYCKKHKNVIKFIA